MEKLLSKILISYFLVFMSCDGGGELTETTAFRIIKNISDHEVLVEITGNRYSLSQGIDPGDSIIVEGKC